MGEKQAEGYAVAVSLIGRKARDFFRRRPWARRQEWVGVFDRLSYEHALDIGGDIIQQFGQGTFDELYIVYNDFKSAIQQRVVVEKLLPIESLEPDEASLGGGYPFEPDAEELGIALKAFAAKDATRKSAIEDVMRALLNSAEFVFNH